jgi:hypothetical protein
VDFQFYFSEEDQQIAEKLVRTEEVTVHQNMFASPQVEGITLEFTLDDPVLDEGKPDPARPGEHLWTVLMTNVDLNLRTHYGQGGHITYKMENGIEQFWFRQEDRVAPGSGNAIWTIVEWKELTQNYPDDRGAAGGAAAVQSASWGRIKALF